MCSCGYNVSIFTTHTDPAAEARQLPPKRESMTRVVPFNLVSLASTEAGYKDVKRDFLQSMRDSYQDIVKVICFSRY